MTKATEAFSVRNDQGTLVSFKPGDTVPESIVARVGAHVLDTDPDEAAGPSVEQLTAAGADEAILTELLEAREKIELLESTLEAEVQVRDEKIAEMQAFRDKIESGDLSDLNLDQVGTPPATEEPAGPLFDPAEHSVEAVLEHLEKSSAEESKRVRDAELAGKARKTILGDDA